MSRNQPVLVAPILGLSIPVPTYLGLGFTQPEAIGRINRYCDPKQQSQTATGFTALTGTADQSPAGATACQSDPHQHSGRAQDVLGHEAECLIAARRAKEIEFVVTRRR